MNGFDPDLIGVPAYLREGKYKGIAGRVIRNRGLKSRYQYSGHTHPANHLKGSHIPMDVEVPPYTLLIYDSNGVERCAIGATRDDLFVIGEDEDYPPCGIQTDSGGIGTVKTTHYMGIESGDVTLEYDAYGIQDRIEVFQNGRLLATTKDHPKQVTMEYLDQDNITDDPYISSSSKLKRGEGFVSHTGTLEFQFDAGLSNLVDVVVAGSGTVFGTSWNYMIDCPK